MPAVSQAQMTDGEAVQEWHRLMRARVDCVVYPDVGHLAFLTERDAARTPKVPVQVVAPAATPTFVLASFADTEQAVQFCRNSRLAVTVLATKPEGART